MTFGTYSQQLVLKILHLILWSSEVTQGLQSGNLNKKNPQIYHFWATIPFQGEITLIC